MKTPTQLQPLMNQAPLQQTPPTTQAALLEMVTVHDPQTQLPANVRIVASANAPMKGQ